VSTGSSMIMSTATDSTPRGAGVLQLPRRVYSSTMHWYRGHYDTWSYCVSN